MRCKSTQRIGLMLLFLLLPLGLKAQTDRIQGVVSDADGNPLVGVTILESGTNNGMITDVDGSFSMAVRPGAVLDISSIGYVGQSIEVGTRTFLEITLHENVSALDQIVVVGYGTQRRSDVTGAIASIGDEVIREVPGANITQALQGRVAGINISQNSTRPGQAGQIRIRGSRTLTASNDPLIVLDGIPFTGTINDINPNDIASIDILKDASATAIYGSRGANGVILVTSNRGTRTGLRVSYNGYYGIKSVARKYDVFNADEYVALREYAGQFQNTDVEQAFYDAGGETDWQDLMYTTGYVTQHDVNVAGGNDRGQYSFGTGFYKETTVLPGQDFTRFSLSGSLDQQIGRFIKVGFSTQNSYGVTGGESANFMYSIITSSPISPAYNDDGSINVQPNYPNDDYFSPLLVKDTQSWDEKRKRFSSFNSLYGEIKFTDFLKYRINIGLTYIQDNYGSYYGQNTPFRNTSVSQATVENTLKTDYTIENLLYYEQTFNNVHRLNGTALFSVQETEWNTSYMEAYDILATQLRYNNLGLYNALGGNINIPSDKQIYQKSALLSYMFRLNYGYDNRYIATATLRHDGSSVLAPGNKWHTYPAISLAWNISNEGFLSNASKINLLKLRAGFGQTANQAVAPYTTLGAVAQNKYNFGSSYLYGYYLNTLPNEDLGWEYTNTWNVGLDFSFFDNRLSGSVEWYTQHTYDLLMNQSIPQTAGVPGSVTLNAGETKNTGMEFTLSGDIIRNTKFQWSMDFNIYYNKNKIVKLLDGVEQDESNGWFVGQPIDVIYDYKKIGIWQLGEETEATKYGAVPGDVKIADIDEDGEITTADRTIIGQFSPKFEGGFTSRMYYKNFDLTIVGFFRVGGKLFSSIHSGAGYTNMLQGRRNQIKVDYWTEENPTNKFPKPGAGDQPTSNTNYAGSIAYFDAGFLKIRSITLGYNFPEKWMDAIGLKGARVYFTAQNPFVWFSDYVKNGGVDPEANLQGTSSLTGNSYGIQNRSLIIGLNTPPTRQWIFGLNINF